MRKIISIKAVILGFSFTLILMLVFAMGSTQIAALGMETWRNEKMNIGRPWDERQVRQEGRDYFNQWYIVLFRVVCLAISFVIGGYTTAKMAKHKVYLHGGITGGMASVFTFSFFIPVFVLSSIVGAYLAGPKVNENHI